MQPYRGKAIAGRQDSIFFMAQHVVEMLNYLATFLPTLNIIDSVKEIIYRAFRNKKHYVSIQTAYGGICEESKLHARDH